jgi:hypothetical protein
MTSKDLQKTFEGLYVSQVCTGGTVSTSAVKVWSGSTEASARYRMARLKVVNGHASNILAWQIVEAGASAPTFTATYATTAGSIVLPGTAEYVNIRSDMDLYVIGSAASTSYCIVAYTTDQ